MTLSKREMYRLPWSMDDNPIGWLEITDRCNIECPGCYRQRVSGHRPLEDILADIRLYKKWRNCYHVSIGGGEPLLHPHLLDIVAAIRQLDMKPLLPTNAHALTPDVLRELKKAGLFGVALHIDRLQKRSPRWNGKTEAELNELRQHYVDMVHAVGGLYCNTGATIYRDNLHEIPDIVRWANSNIDRLHGLTLVAFGSPPVSAYEMYTLSCGAVLSASETGFTPDPLLVGSDGVKAEDIWRQVRTAAPHYDAAAYLGGTLNHETIKWLVGVQVGTRSRMLGALGARSLEAIQSAHHWRTGRYITYTESNRVGAKVFLLALADKRLRQAVRTWVGSILGSPLRLFEPVRIQGVGIVIPPEVQEDGRVEMCESCPDLVIYNGNLVPCCRLDEWRFHGSLLSPVTASLAADRVTGRR